MGFNNINNNINNTNEYIFTDYGISAGSSNNWSFPNYPSHIDHIIISNELFEYEYLTTTVLVDNLFLKFQEYDNFISDKKNKSYVGYTNNLSLRISKHNSNTGAKSTKGYKWILIYKKKFYLKSKAMSFEYKLKKDRRMRKKILELKK